MSLDLTPAIFVAIIVLLVLAVRTVATFRIRSGGRLPDVGDAPASAQPIATPRLDDLGLGTYSLDLHGRRRSALIGRDPGEPERG